MDNHGKPPPCAARNRPKRLSRLRSVREPRHQAAEALHGTPVYVLCGPGASHLLLSRLLILRISNIAAGTQVSPPFAALLAFESTFDV
jgi:hypothetical protein